MTYPRNPGIQFTTPTQGWMIVDSDAGASAALLASTDGGTTWQQTAPHTSKGFYGLQFAGQQDGWVVGYAALYRTTDGGTAWSAVGEPATPLRVLSKLDFVGATLGWGVTLTESLVESTDGGETWSVVTVPIHPNDMCFSSATLGWVVEGNTIYVTNDGGGSWSLADALPSSTATPIGWLQCSGPTAWIQFGLGAGLYQTGLIDVSTHAGAQPGGWHVVGASGPLTTGLQPLPLTADSVPIPLLLGSDQVLLGSWKPPFSSPTGQLAIRQSTDAGASFAVLGTPLTLRGTTSEPEVCAFTGTVWLVVRKPATLPLHHDNEIYRSSLGDPSWHQIATVLTAG